MEDSEHIGDRAKSPSTQLLEDDVHQLYTSTTNQQQRLEWIRLQREVASQVVEVHDDSIFSTCSATERNAQDDTEARFIEVNMMDYLTGPHGIVDCSTNDGPSVHGLRFGGVDASFPENETGLAVAVYVIVEYPTMKVIYTATEYFALTVPYIPSFFAFREIDPLERLVQAQVQCRPEITPCAILVDGNGILHSRRAGIACFLGVRTGIPTIGIGKTLFCEGGLTKELVSSAVWDAVVTVTDKKRTTLAKESRCDDTGIPILLFDRRMVSSSMSRMRSKRTGENADAALDRETVFQDLSKLCHGLAIPLWAVDKNPLDTSSSPAKPSTGRILACALVGHGGRHRNNKPRTVGSQNPIFVSVGHKVSLPQAVAISAALSLARIPEPVRQADLIGRQLLRNSPVVASRKNMDSQRSQDL